MTSKLDVFWRSSHHLTFEPSSAPPSPCSALPTASDHLTRQPGEFRLEMGLFHSGLRSEQLADLRKLTPC